MEKTSIKKNYIYNLSYQILQIILPIITVPYVSRILKVEGIGIQSFVASIASYFTLFGSLGLGLYGQREIAFQQNDLAKRTKVFWELFFFKLITISISLLIYFIIIRTITNNYNIFFLYSLEIIACCLDITWYYQGLEYFKKILIRNIIVRITSTFFIFIFVKNESDLYKYIFLILIGSYCVNISLIPFLLKDLVKIKLRSLNILQHIRPVIVLFIPQIAIHIYTVLDKSMIGFITKSTVENGYYEQALKIVKLVLTIITSLGIVVAPRISNLYSNQKYDEIKERLHTSFKFVFFLGTPMLFGLIGISDIFVPLFFGPGYDKSIILIKILSGLFIAIGLNNVIGIQYLISSKKENIFTISVITGAIINFILNIFLISKYKSIGAAISSVVSESIVTIVQFIYIRKILDIRKIFLQSYYYIISSIIMFFVLFILKIFIHTNLVSLITMVVVGCSVYFIILTIFRDVFVSSAICMISRRFKNEKKY
jgi:O-antigen/teichoic acid export membrane protein